MSMPKKPLPEMTKLLEKASLSELDPARSNDKAMARLARDNYGPLPDDQTPDVLEELEMAWGMHVGMDDGGDAE